MMNIDENGSLNPRSAESGGRMTGPATFCRTIRVAYHETDGQGRVHHANYLNYLEQSRVEMLRFQGVSYKEFEEQGLMLVVSEINVNYRSAAKFDDLLAISTTVTAIRGVRICHKYVIDRDGEIIVEAESTIACIDRNGKVSRLPKEWLSRFNVDSVR